MALVEMADLQNLSGRKGGKRKLKPAVPPPGIADKVTSAIKWFFGVGG